MWSAWPKERETYDFSEPVDPATRRAEQVAFGLRTNRGVARELLPEDKTSEFEKLGFLKQRSEARGFSRAKGACWRSEFAETLME